MCCYQPFSFPYSLNFDFPRSYKWEIFWLRGALILHESKLEGKLNFGEGTCVGVGWVSESESESCTEVYRVNSYNCKCVCCVWLIYVVFIQSNSVLWCRDRSVKHALTGILQTSYMHVVKVVRWGAKSANCLATIDTRLHVPLLTLFQTHFLPPLLPHLIKHTVHVLTLPYL